MAYVYKKTVGDKIYYYLRASKRSGKRIIAKDIAYLGKTLDEVRASLKKMHGKEIRAAYRTITRFLESNSYLEKAKKLKLRHSEYIKKETLEELEGCKLHWQQAFQKHDSKTRQEYLKGFIIEFAFNTTSIEGNTITLKETERLLTEQLTPKNKTLREIYDIQNTERVFSSILEEPDQLSQETLINIHKELMMNIDSRTGYRTGDVRIIRSRFKSTPYPYIKADMYLLLKWYMEKRGRMHPLALAGIFHHKFEKIHPFFDGNGRTGRMVLNAMLLSEGYPPMIIQKKTRARYLDALGNADAAELDQAKPGHYRKLIEYLASEYTKNYWNNFL